MILLALAITLTWPDPANNPTTTSYHVYRGAGQCSTATFERLTTNPTPARTYTDNPAAGAWCYRMTAVSNGVESDPSPTVQVSTKPSPPGAPTATVSSGPG